MFVPLCEKKNLRFDTQFSFERQLVVDCDSLKLKQIVINLLSNAVKYTLKGGVKLTVSYEGNHIRILVQDSGVGVAKDKLDKIFEPFVRIEENSSIAEGSGLGMYVVKGLVDLFGGTIKAESMVGKGTTFSLVIPADAVTAHGVRSKTKHVLLVDDDPALLLTLKSMVIQLGHQADACQSMKELKKRIASIGEYDFVLTDMEMGADSGLDSLENIRKVNADIPVILMTARSEINDQQVKLMGFSGCLSKPISLNVLSVLLGESEKKVEPTTPGKAVHEKVPFAELEQMLGNDKEAILSVLSAFVENSQNDIAELEKAVSEKDFEKAQQRCHKMLSMFMQIDPENRSVEVLKKMDASRNVDQKFYQGWESDVKSIVKSAEKLLAEISRYVSHRK